MCQFSKIAKSAKSLHPSLQYKLQVVETALKCGGFSVLMHSLQYTVQTKLNFFQVE